MKLLKKNSKKKILIIIGIILIIGIIVFIILKKDVLFKNSIVLKDNSPIVENIKVNNFNEIMVISSRIEKLDKVSSIFIKIKNNTGSDIDKCELKLTIYDKNNNILLVSLIKDFNDFKKEQTREFQVSTNNDLSNADRYVVEKI